MGVAAAKPSTASIIAAVILVVVLATSVLLASQRCKQPTVQDAFSEEDVIDQVNAKSTAFYKELRTLSEKVDVLDKSKLDQKDAQALRNEVQNMRPALRNELETAFVNRQLLDERLQKSTDSVRANMASLQYVDTQFAKKSDVLSTEQNMQQSVSAVRSTATDAINMARAAAPSSWVKSTFVPRTDYLREIANLQTKANVADVNRVAQNVDRLGDEVRQQTQQMRNDIGSSQYVTKTQGDSTYARKDAVTQLEQNLRTVTDAYRAQVIDVIQNNPSNAYTAMLLDVNTRMGSLGKTMEETVQDYKGRMTGITNTRINKDAVVVGGQYKMEVAPGGRLSITRAAGAGSAGMQGLQADEVHGLRRLVAQQDAELRGRVLLGDAVTLRPALVSGFADADLTGSIRLRGDAVSRVEGSLQVDGELLVRGTRLDPGLIAQLDDRLKVMEERLQAATRAHV